MYLDYVAIWGPVHLHTFGTHLLFAVSNVFGGYCYLESLFIYILFQYSYFYLYTTRVWYVTDCKLW